MQVSRTEAAARDQTGGKILLEDDQKVSVLRARLGSGQAGICRKRRTGTGLNATDTGWRRGDPATAARPAATPEITAAPMSHVPIRKEDIGRNKTDTGGVQTVFLKADAPHPKLDGENVL